MRYASSSSLPGCPTLCQRLNSCLVRLPAYAYYTLRVLHTFHYRWGGSLPDYRVLYMCMDFFCFFVLLVFPFQHCSYISTVLGCFVLVLTFNRFVDVCCQHWFCL